MPNKPSPQKSVIISTSLTHGSLNNMYTHALRLLSILSVILTACLFSSSLFALERYSYSNEHGLHFGTHIEIDKPPTDVWQELIDIKSFPQWNPFTPKVETTFEVGTPIVMQVRLIRAFPFFLIEQKETVADFQAPTLMCWRAFQIHPILFSSKRCYRLEAIGSSKTKLSNTMHYSGLLNFIIGPATQELVMHGFEDVSTALKKRLETN